MSVLISSILFGLVITTALPNGTDQIGLLGNVTNAPGLGVIDPRFTTDYRPGQDRLLVTSCLMNVVNAMMELALEDFTEPIRPRDYMDPRYPRVMIVPIMQAWGQKVEARYLLWGIWEGIRWMISHQSFRDLMIGAYWDGIRICRIWIRGARRQPRIAGSNGTLGITARSETTPIHPATIETTQGLSKRDVRYPLNDDHLRVSVTKVGDLLDITEVFAPIFTALEYMAHFPSADQVVEFQIFPDDEHTTIRAQGTQAPGVGPPFLDYQWVILSIGRIPEYMLQQSRFTEVDFDIAVDGVLLGKGFLSRRKPYKDHQVSGPGQTLSSISKG